MTTFSPFAGLRYNTAKVSLGDVTAPPYDVINDSQREKLVKRHVNNIVKIDLPVDEDGKGRYEVAAELLRHWQDEEVLSTDLEPAFYGYRMSFTDSVGRALHTTGVIGELKLSAPGEGNILPHEHTTPKAKSDRLEMLRACRANLSCIWGLTPADGLTDLIGEPHVDDPVWVDEDGTEHTMWVISDPARINAIETAVSRHPVVIADGHHRYETSVAYRDEQRELHGGDAGAAEAAMIYIVELISTELTVLPIHRLINGLPEGFDLLEALSPWFNIEDNIELDSHTLDTMIDNGILVLVLPNSAKALRPRPGAFDVVRDLDTSRVDAALAQLPAHELTFQHGIDEIQQIVRSGGAQAGILVRPVGIDAISATASGGERMPPKSTFFHPKPRTGPVIRLLG